MNPLDFRKAMRPALRHLGLYSLAAENLLFGTAAHESGGFRYLYQVGGPALGVFQMEPNTLDDLYANFLSFRPTFERALEELRPQALSREEALSGCLAYAAGAARLQYYRDAAPLPAADDIEALAAFYKRVWNTSAGKATEQDFIDAYTRYSI